MEAVLKYLLVPLTFAHDCTDIFAGIDSALKHSFISHWHRQPLDRLNDRLQQHISRQFVARRRIGKNEISVRQTRSHFKANIRAYRHPYVSRQLSITGLNRVVHVGPLVGQLVHLLPGHAVLPDHVDTHVEDIGELLVAARTSRLASVPLQMFH